MLERPGFGLPLETYTRAPVGVKPHKPAGFFPSAVHNWLANTPTVRERGMLWFVNHVTEKPRWWEKVHDEAIVEKWKTEIGELAALQTGRQAEIDAERKRARDSEVEVNNEDNDGDEDEDEADSDAEAAQAEVNASAVATEETPTTAAEDTGNNGDANVEENANENIETGSADEGPAENENDEEGNDDDENDDDDEDDDDYDDDEDGPDSLVDGLFSGRGSNVDSDDFGLDSDMEREIAKELREQYQNKLKNEKAPPLPLSHGFSDAMFDFCIKELRDKAELYKAHEIVGTLDGATGVFKSDTAVSEDVKEALRKAVKPLEDVPENEKDWHPGSNEQVLDLVHPSLWPLVYGKTRILADRELTLDTCMSAYGSGETIPVLDYKPSRGYNSRHLYSTKFQWLPAEVDVSSSAKILSYINNLPPAEHKDLYAAVEKVIDASLPLWSAVYEQTMSWGAMLEDPKSEPSYMKPGERLSRSRIHAFSAERICSTPDICNNSEWEGCNRENRPNRTTDEQLEEAEDEEGDGDVWEERDDADEEWFAETHEIVKPEPIPYTFLGYKNYRTSGPWFTPFTDTSRIQVIVKLANIELTPEKPSYPGGSWHIEGQLNEHICATALYYYDNDNVTPSRLAFRTLGDAEQFAMTFNYEQGVHAAFNHLYGNEEKEDALTLLGDVDTREGRLLVFPNVYQHQVQPFELADKTKPGHRKILALFLVDPKAPVISTANVPPQQKHWGRLANVENKLPPELTQMIYDDIACPYSLNEARKLREELMEERKGLDQSTAEILYSSSFSLCEH